MSLEQFVFVALVVAVAAFCQAVSGFGFALLAVPLMVFVVDLKTAVVTATAVSLVSTSAQWYESRAVKVREMSRRLIFSAFLGMPLGLWLLSDVDGRVMKGALGCAVLVGVVLTVKGADLQRLPLAFDIAMGAVSGVLSTATSTNGPPLVFLLHSRKYSPNNFRAVLNRVFTVSSIVSLAMFWLAGKITYDSMLLALVSMPVMGIAVWAGTRSRKFVDQDQFRNLVIMLLLLSGVSAIVNALAS